MLPLANGGRSRHDRDHAARVFLVDDHQLFLAGVRAELGAVVDVVGAASDVDAAIEMIRERVPDVVLVDVHMPAGGGARVISEVGARRIPTCSSSRSRSATRPKT